LYEFIIHPDATSDLRDILLANRLAGLRLTAFLRELRDDQYLLDRLNQKNYGGSPAKPRPQGAKFNSGIWVAGWDEGMNLWRVRCFQSEALPYRMIVAYRPEIDQYVLLAVTEKAAHNDPDDKRFNYELDHPIAIRIAASYRKLLDG